MSQKAEEPQQHNPTSRIQQKQANMDQQISQDMHWMGQYLDGKYVLAHPLAIDKVKRLSQQIIEQKARDQEDKQDEKPQNQLKKQHDSVISQVHHMRPDSALSRQCKTELNQIKVLKAKRDSEKKLLEEEEKYRAKFEQLRHNLEQKKQNKNGTQFVIKQHRKSSHKNQSVNASVNKSKVGTNNQKQISGVASKASQLGQQSKRYSKSPSGQAAPLNNFASFHPLEKEKVDSPRFMEKKSVSKAEQDINQKESLRYSQQQSKITNSIQNKSVNKSFVINSRKTPSQSKDFRRQSSAMKDNQRKSLSSVTSRAQLQNLNKKIRQMQEKLQSVQQRQTELEKLQMSRVHPNEENEQKKPITEEEDKRSGYQSFCHYENRESGEDKIGKNIPSPSQKNYKIQKSAKVEEFTSSRKKSSEKQSKDGKRETVFDMVICKNQRLNVSSSIYSYNNTEELRKKKSQEKKINERQSMSQEIAGLKKTIRELKLERIKHQAIIQEFQKLAKEKQREDIDRQIKEKLKGQQNETVFKQKSWLPTQKDEKQKSKRKTTENRNETEENQQSLEKEEAVKQKTHNSGVNQKPNIKNLRIQTKEDKFFNSRVIQRRMASNQNPEEPAVYGKEYHPRSLSRKGIIVRQIFNPSNDSQLKIVSQSRGDDSRISNQIDPPSPTSTGRKVFELQFVHVQKQDSVMSEDIQTLNPQIDVEGFPIPELPAPPTPEITQSELLKLAKSICELFEITVDKDEHLYMKKYKNCIIFKTPDPKKTIVWHYSGKFYLGGWEQNEHGEGKKTGEGFEYIPEKHCYKGQFYNGKKNGSGTIVQQNGNIYKGQWEGGEKHGQGKYYEKSTGIVYEGEWKNSKKDGKGLQKVSQNEYYDGTFVKSIKHGFGTEIFANGDKYHGEYKIGRFHGKGKYVWANGSSYDGQFIQGHRQGQGRWKSCKKGGDKYVGGYKKDKKSGKGKYTWANGCIYDGQFLQDLKHGEGRVSYPDGREAKGYWQQGKLVQIISQTQPEDGYSNHHKQYTISMKSTAGKVVEAPSKDLQSSKCVFNNI